MKKSAKIWLITAACLVLAGGVVCCLAMAAHHWDFSLLGEKAETRTVEINEDFQNISIKSDTDDVEFRLSDDGKCKVVCLEKEKEQHTVAVNGGTLVIEKNDTRDWNDFISLFSFESTSITVYLPQSEYDSLFIDEDTGDITIPEEFVFGSIDIGVDTGDVDCRASASELLRIKSDTGDIHLEGLSAGELDLTVSTGHIDARSVVCDGNIGITVSTGKTNLTDVSCKSFSSTGDTGDIIMKKTIAEGMISIERSTGDVSFDGCDAGELMIETDTGDVKGDLLSDKIFIARSDTGGIDVPETATGGKCKITTETGDIKIVISQ